MTELLEQAISELKKLPDSQYVFLRQANRKINY
jgi:hypothetical protein